MARFLQKHLFIDFDGTLMDTSEGIYNSFDHVCDVFGMERKGHDFYSRLIGPPLMHSFKNAFGFGDSDARRAMEAYREYYTPKGLYEVRVYDGVPEMLCSLKEAGKKLYVATSKPEFFARELLKKFSLLERFDFVGGSDMEETRVSKSDVIRYVLKENSITQKDDCLMIGDRRFDVEGASEAGLSTLGILWGFGSKEELLESGASGVAKTPLDVVGLLT